MEKVKDGKIFFLKGDRRKCLKVIYQDGDAIGVIPSIVFPKPDEKIIYPNNRVYWTTEKEMLESGHYTTL